MSSVSQSCSTLTKCPPLVHESKITRSSLQQLKFYHNRHTFPILHSFNAYRVARRGHAMVACSAKDLDSGKEEPSALETVQKLYEAMRNRSVHEISDIIAEECLCLSNFFSTLQPFHGKKQVLEFFSCLMKKMGNNIEFAVKNTVDDGMVVVVSWKLEWNKVPLSLGKEFSFYMCHVYMGKVMIKNVEIFLEPLVQCDHLRLKFIRLVMSIMGKLNLLSLFKYRRRLRSRDVILILLLMLAILFFLKSGFAYEKGSRMRV